MDEKNISIVAQMTNYYDEPQHFWTMGGRIIKIRGSRFADLNKLDSELTHDDKEVGFVSGCYILILKDEIKRIGLFGENYFLYAEGTDFYYRLKKAVYKIYVTTQSKIFHKAYKSTKKKLPSLPLYYATIKRLYFLRKNFGNYFPLTLFFISTAMLLKHIYWFVNENPKIVLSFFKAFNDYFSHKMYIVDPTTFLSADNSK